MGGGGGGSGRSGCIAFFCPSCNVFAIEVTVHL